MHKISMNKLLGLISLLAGLTAHADTNFSYPLEADIEGVSTKIVVSNFGGRGKNNIVSLAFRPSVNFPTDKLICVVNLDKGKLSRIWTSPALNATEYGVGNLFGKKKQYLLFAKQVGVNNVLQAMDESKTLLDVFSITGDIADLAVADINNDGVDEIIIGRKLKQYDEIAQGEIGIYRWNGKGYEEGWRITPKPNEGAGVSGYSYFRVFDLDGDGQLEIVADEESQNYGTRIKVFSYDRSVEEMLEFQDGKYATLLQNNLSANAGAISIGKDRYLLISQGDKIGLFSVKDSRLVRTLEMPSANITSGDIDNDGFEELVITSTQRINRKRSMNISILKKENLLPAQ